MGKILFSPVFSFEKTIPKIPSLPTFGKYLLNKHKFTYKNTHFRNLRPPFCLPTSQN
jgi:hypothetical protein